MEPLDSAAYADGTLSGTAIAVHTGFPNPAAERQGAPLSLDRLLVKHPSSTYFFRIRGHSWHRHGVFDGDLAIVDRALTPADGDLVVWWESTGEFRLSPFARADRQNIWGTITAIIHPFAPKND